MVRFNLTVAGGLLAALGWAGVAGAQTGAGMVTVGSYPTPPGYNQGVGSYVVAPGLPGSGGTYSYVQQNRGAVVGMSPNAYYSQNFFTSTPMTTSAPNAYSYSSPYTSPYTPPGAATVPVRGTVTTGYTAVPTNGVYSGANATYYRVRRGGPLRRMFGR